MESCEEFYLIKKILKNIKSTSEKTKLAGWKNTTKTSPYPSDSVLKKNRKEEKNIFFFSGDVNSKLRTRLNVL